MKNHIKKIIVNIVAAVLSVIISVFSAVVANATSCTYSNCEAANASFPCQCGDYQELTSASGPQAPYCYAAKSAATNNQNSCKAMMSNTANKSNGSSCSADNECASGVCSYTYCVPNSTYCGGVKDPMYFANGATAGNQWLDGVCRNGVWKTVLNGTGCDSFACDGGSCSGNKCVAATSGKLTTEQIQAMIAQIKELINSLIAQLAQMTS